MAEYGLFRGLNEGYQAYRRRERDIEDRDRREWQDEQAQIEADLREEQAARTREQYQYGVSLRPMQEKAADIALQGAQQEVDQSQELYEYGVQQRPFQEEAADVALQSAQQDLTQKRETHKEWQANANNRAVLNKLNLDKARKELDNAGLQYDQNQIKLQAMKGKEKYDQWTKEWLRGGTMKDIVRKFNNDEDDTNNIRAVTGDETKGWDVTFENGRKMRFEDRDQVAIHLQSMADENFHQTYLLQLEAGKAALAKAIDTATRKSADQQSKDKKQWEDMTRQQVKDYFTESIKESIVSLGSEGARDIAGDVRAAVDSIGASSGYGMVNSDVTRVANQMAKRMLVKEPAERRKMAAETMDALRETGADVPKEGDDGYEEALNRQMAEDYDRAYDTYKRAVYTKFAHLTESGNVVWKDYRQISDASRPEDLSTDNEISDAGLQRPGSAQTLASAEDFENGGDGVVVLPQVKTGPEVVEERTREGIGGEEYYEKITGLASRENDALQYKAKLEDKLGITRTDGPAYRKSVGTYVKSPEFFKLPEAEQYQILDLFEDALTKPQIRKAKAAIRKNAGRQEIYGLN